jgi:hypothetical protein
MAIFVVDASSGTLFLLPPLAIHLVAPMMKALSDLNTMQLEARQDQLKVQPVCPSIFLLLLVLLIATCRIQ